MSESAAQGGLAGRTCISMRGLRPAFALWKSLWCLDVCSLDVARVAASGEEKVGLPHGQRLRACRTQLRACTSLRSAASSVPSHRFLIHKNKSFLFPSNTLIDVREMLYPLCVRCPSGTLRDADPSQRAPFSQTPDLILESLIT